MYVIVFNFLFRHSGFQTKVAPHHNLFGPPLNVTLWAEFLPIEDGMLKEFDIRYSHNGKEKAYVRNWSFVPADKISNLRYKIVRTSTKEAKVTRIGRCNYLHYEIYL